MVAIQVWPFWIVIVGFGFGVLETGLPELDTSVDAVRQGSLTPAVGGRMVPIQL